MGGEAAPLQQLSFYGRYSSDPLTLLRVMSDLVRRPDDGPSADGSERPDDYYHALSIRGPASREASFAHFWCTELGKISGVEATTDRLWRDNTRERTRGMVRADTARVCPSNALRDFQGDMTPGNAQLSFLAPTQLFGKIETKSSLQTSLVVVVDKKAESSVKPLISVLSGVKMQIGTMGHSDGTRVPALLLSRTTKGRNTKLEYRLCPSFEVHTTSSTDGTLPGKAQPYPIWRLNRPWLVANETIDFRPGLIDPAGINTDGKQSEIASQPTLSGQPDILTGLRPPTHFAHDEGAGDSLASGPSFDFQSHYYQFQAPAPLSDLGPASLGTVVYDSMQPPSSIDQDAGLPSSFPPLSQGETPLSYPQPGLVYSTDPYVRVHDLGRNFDPMGPRWWWDDQHDDVGGGEGS